MQKPRSRDSTTGGSINKDKISQPGVFHLKITTQLDMHKANNKHTSIKTNPPQNPKTMYKTKENTSKNKLQKLQTISKTTMMPHRSTNMLPKVAAKPANCKTTKIGREYAAHVNVTENGLSCQMWADQTPHDHGMKKYEHRFPEKSLHLARNYCRNPDLTEGGPWCYTLDADIRWQYCSIKCCPGSSC